MITLDKLKNFDFNAHGYNKGTTNDIKKRITKLLQDNEIVWEKWKNENDRNANELELNIDFNFFTKKKELATMFCNELIENNYSATFKGIRVLKLFKAYEILVSKKKNWTLQLLNEEIETLGLLGIVYHCHIEGYGALIE